ncbi:hypothetical protein X743_17785 [Mesorhizobium sp. LNHC252B00]|uniref:hypothetical protein n=1 Tax=Mesorhizobium sp. LNHC252B00 TaxID=1287252 RepID=UPI0003CF3BA2|nr:hypothetical protein [Mesorhizobium sp. LNHC252B00]ESY72299.1 hypothetical protein X743_17785 [Mesorhizobium sp. LNHC252B00]
MDRGLFAWDEKYVGKAVIATTNAIKDRLRKRVQQARSSPAGAVVTPDVERVKPIKASVRTLRGERKLRHASMQNFREES